MTTTEPNADGERRGRHAKSDDDRTADPADRDREPVHASSEDDRQERPADDEDGAAHDESHEDDVPEGDRSQDDHSQDDHSENEQRPEETPAEQRPPEPPRPQERPREDRQPKPSRLHAIAHHPAGPALLTAAALITGLSLVPLLFDQLHFEVATRAADAARSAAAPWPAGGQPWFWSGWLAMLAAVVAVAVLVVAAVGVRLPDVVVLVTAVVLTATTARAAWATFAVVNAHLWELVPVCLVCLIAFASAFGAVFRWRSGESAAAGTGAGEVAGVTVGSWLLVVLLLLGGSAIASSARTHAFGNVTSPPKDLAGLLSVRAADAPQLRDLHGSWVPQLAAAKVGDDATATAYAVLHNGFTSRFPTVLARGDDVGASDLDRSWWLSLAVAKFDSADTAAGWCSASGIVGCTPRKIG